MPQERRAPTAKELGKKFEQLRLKHGYITQAALARKLGVSAPITNKIERGVFSVSYEVIYAMSKLTGTPLEYWLE